MARASGPCSHRQDAGATPFVLTSSRGCRVRDDVENAGRIIQSLKQFGFTQADDVLDTLLKNEQIVRLGVPPLRIEVLTSISGVRFDACVERAVRGAVDGVDGAILGLEDLRVNKGAAGRHQDLEDLQHLPPAE